MGEREANEPTALLFSVRNREVRPTGCALVVGDGSVLYGTRSGVVKTSRSTYFAGRRLFAEYLLPRDPDALFDVVVDEVNYLIVDQSWLGRIRYWLEHPFVGAEARVSTELAMRHLQNLPEFRDPLLLGGLSTPSELQRLVGLKRLVQLRERRDKRRAEGER